MQGVVCCGGGREFAGQTCAQIYRADSAKLPGWEGRCPNRRLRSPDSAAKLAHAPGTVGAEKQFQAPPQFVRWGHFAYIYAEKKHLNYPLQFSIDVERAVALCSAAMRGRGARFMHWARAISEAAGGGVRSDDGSGRNPCRKTGSGVARYLYSNEKTVIIFSRLSRSYCAIFIPHYLEILHPRTPVCRNLRTGVRGCRISGGWRADSAKLPGWVGGQLRETARGQAGPRFVRWP